MRNVPYLSPIIHYAILIVSVPAVNVVTLSSPSVAVLDVSPLPIVSV